MLIYWYTQRRFTSKLYTSFKCLFAMAGAIALHGLCVQCTQFKWSVAYLDILRRRAENNVSDPSSFKLSQMRACSYNVCSASILSLHTDVSVRACTSLRPFVITSKEKSVVAELLDTVAKHRFVQKISVLSE